MAICGICVFGLLVISGRGLANEDFSYEGSHGPSHWGDDYNTCVGKHQSPINIEEHIVKTVTLPSLKFSGLEAPRDTHIINNGHTVMLRMNNSESAEISGGPLGTDTYAFEQMHFHWGENDFEGSEDKINNHSFAMELHAVFYKKKYGSMGAAVRNVDGLTVLAYFFEVSEKDNPTFDTLVNALPSIEKENSHSRLSENLKIDSFLTPKTSMMHNYFTYNGSLTTPPCSEVVIWIDFKDPLSLSHKQIEAFRNLRSTEGHKLTHNYRPVQPLEDRIVYHNVGVNENHTFAEESTKAIWWADEHHSGQFRIDNSLLSTITTVLLTLRPTLASMIFEDLL